MCVGREESLQSVVCYVKNLVEVKMHQDHVSFYFTPYTYSISVCKVVISKELTVVVCQDL